MIQPPTAMSHPIKQYNQSVFQSTSRNNDNQQSGPHSAAGKMSHHSQEMPGFYNQQMNYGGHQPYNSNGAGSSNNFYQPFNNNMGHYSVSRQTFASISRLTKQFVSRFFTSNKRRRSSSNSPRTGTNNSNISDKLSQTNMIKVVKCV